MTTPTDALQKPTPGCRASSSGAPAVLEFALAAQCARAQPSAPSDANRTVNVNSVYAANLGFGGYSLAGLTADVFALPLDCAFPLGNGES